MKTIEVQFSQGTGIDASLDSCRKLLIDDQSFGGGGFGDVYHCRNVDGRVVTPLVVKIFHPGTNRCLKTTALLQERLKDEHHKRVQAGSSLFADYPALAGIPLLSFTGTLDGKTVTGCVARDLVADGLEELQAVEENAAAHKRFQQIPILTKLQMASQFVRALDFLNNEIFFLHCDLKPGAFFFSAKPARCVLIDFDGGAVLRDPKDEPSTPGTPEGWVAPEVRMQMDSVIPPDFVKVSLASEQWSAACAVHFLLFGCSHDFFLTELSERSMRAYQQGFSWPEVNASFSYLKSGIGPITAVHNKYVKMLPGNLQRYLSFTFTQGYFDAGQRTTCGQWKIALELTQKPAIHSFDTDTPLITNKRPIELRWAVTAAEKLVLRGFGDVTGRDSCMVSVTKATTFELVLTTNHGKSITKTLRVEVDDRPPLIRTLRINRSFLTDSTPARLDWSVERAVKIELQPGIGDVTGRTFIDLLPRQDTTYHLYAYSGLDVISSATVTVTVSKQPPRIAFKASESITVPETPVEIVWTTSGAESVEITPGIGRVLLEGSREISVIANTKFTLTATSYFGTVSQRHIHIYVAKRTILNPNPTQRVSLTAPISVRTSALARTTLLIRSVFDRSDTAKHWKTRFARATNWL